MRRINQRAMSRVVIWFLNITSSRRRPKEMVATGRNLLSISSALSEYVKHL